MATIAAFPADLLESHTRGCRSPLDASCVQGGLRGSIVCVKDSGRAKREPRGEPQVVLAFHKLLDACSTCAQGLMERNWASQSWMRHKGHEHRQSWAGSWLYSPLSVASGKFLPRSTPLKISREK